MLNVSRFFKRFFDVLSVLLSAITLIAPVAAPFGLVISACTAGGAVIFQAASWICQESIEGAQLHSSVAARLFFLLTQHIL